MPNVSILVPAFKPDYLALMLDSARKQSYALWGRIASGGVVLLDDYGYQPQKDGLDAWAEKNLVPIASLPTGQGLIIKT